MIYIGWKEDLQKTTYYYYGTEDQCIYLYSRNPLKLSTKVVFLLCAPATTVLGIVLRRISEASNVATSVAFIAILICLEYGLYAAHRKWQEEFFKEVKLYNKVIDRTNLRDIYRDCKKTRIGIAILVGLSLISVAIGVVLVCDKGDVFSIMYSAISIMVFILLIIVLSPIDQVKLFTVVRQLSS